MQVQIEKRYYTPEEYCRLEETAEYKNEYLDGEITPMVGATTNHNLIALNFCRNFPANINNQDYWVLMSDVRLWMPSYRFYTYPDVMVIKDKPLYEGKGTNTVTNALIIVEVLSKSTRDYDRTDKFKFYRSIPEFKEYILIDQYRYYVEQFYQHNNGEWLFKASESDKDALRFHPLDFQMSLLDIYQRIDFNLSEE
ncbi:MAG: Uma2 family endonuclease [Microcystis aeruginosa W13-15]|jgi:Uma2 family endonuclease|nr:Uma2 family endonuclease [Microcystis aeruginosa W13-16]NCQ74602.1 Uma2 family endonuclease [Microcystis aeruginosa W13-13]NCQ79069.1 Uma2 family endonuclease [Microcystis aeruginosa W13-15]NCS53131.1 Uma2 family endonuclease [Microcystis aeruginosa G13-05]